MSEKILHFIKYNNAFVIGFVIVFLGVGISYAADPQVRDSIYSTESTLTSVDNGLIVSADLDNFNFNLKITSITEDEKNYYAIYSYQTLFIEDGIWKNKELEKTLTVEKEALGGKDLGLYVAQELGENMNYELSYLKRVQKAEKEKGKSQKVVTIEYAGLIGKLLDPKEMVIEGYSPVIPEPVEPEAPVEENQTEVVVSTPYSEIPPEGGAETSPEIIPDSTPSPEEMIDEGLVQEVVEALLPEEAPVATSTEENIETPSQAEIPPQVENTGTSEITSSDLPETAVEPEVTTITPSQEASETPQVVTEPAPQSLPEQTTGTTEETPTPTPEVTPPANAESTSQ